MAASAEALLAEVPIPIIESEEGTPPSLAAGRACVDWMVSGVSHLNKKVGFEPQTAILMHDLVLGSANQAAILWRHGLASQARSSLLHAWIDQSVIFEASWKHLYDFRDELVHGLFSPSATRFQASELDREFLLVFHLAVFEKLIGDQAEAQGRQALRNLIARLDLSHTQLAAMLGVSAETVDQWEAGQIVIPADARASLNRVNSALNRMVSIFRPERLPNALRQKVELFKGESALDWILQGRIQEVADRYESAFAYQR